MNSETLLTGKVNQSSAAALLSGMNSKKKSESSDFASMLADSFASMNSSSALQNDSEKTETTSLFANEYNPVMSYESSFSSFENDYSYVSDTKRETETSYQSAKAEDEEYRAKDSDNERVEDDSDLKTERKRNKKTEEAAENEELTAADASLEVPVIPEGSEIQSEEISIGETAVETVNELVQNLNSDELQDVIENPEKFVDELVSEIEKLPDSAEKEELLAAVKSEDFLQSAQSAAEKALEAAQQNAAAVNSAAGIENTQKLSNHETVKSINSEALQNSADAENGESQTLQEADAAAGETSENELTDSEAAKATESADADKENKAEAEKTESESTTPEESLRAQFDRIHETGENSKAPEAADASAENDVNSAVPEQSQTAYQAVMQTASGNSKTAATAESAAQKFMNMLGDKTSGSSNAVAGLAHAGESSKRQSMTGGNSGNQSNSSGFGFSFGTGATQATYTRNGTQAAQPASPVFSEMLEKAEYLKTKDGEKVLNLELEQSDLGKLEMELSSKDGTVTARVLVEDQNAKAKMDELAPQLKEQLQEQGVNLAEITVDISSNNADGESKSHQFGEKNKSTRIDSLRTEDAETIIKKNILPNLRRSALNIQAIDMTV